MIYAISIINIQTSNFIVDSENNILKNLSRFNILIGTNNSGKSRFLRNIFNHNKPVHLKFIDHSIKDANFLRKVVASHQTIFRTIREIKRIGATLENYEKFESLINKVDSNKIQMDEVIELIELLTNISETSFSNVSKNYETSINNLKFQLLNVRDDLIKAFDAILINPESMKMLYIPVLRGLRPINSNKDQADVYFSRTKNDYFKETQLQNKAIYTGQTIYNDVVRLLLGDEKDRNEIASFEDFLSRHIFENKKITLIPKYEDDVLHIKIGLDPQTEIFNLGDGLQSIISILFPIHRNKESNQIVLIEEPETHLHPKWQKMLLSALNEFKNNQYFISTHSSAFINYPESSILILRKINEKIRITESNIIADKISILNSLGYKTSDLFQTNYVLWVEGPSDKIYLSNWISKISPHLIEGEHFNIVFFGGSTFKHIFDAGLNDAVNNLARINQNFGIVLDSDRKSKTEHFDIKKMNISKFFEERNYFSWLTKARTIENYIPIEAFTNAVRKVHQNDRIPILDGDFVDRTKIILPQETNSFGHNIKLSDELFKTIQINNGKLGNISFVNLKKEIESSIMNSKQKISKIDKVKVAKEIIANNYEIMNNELMDKVRILSRKIDEANN
jgi:predicted ATP-dependent endonuclease of OLD family